MTIEIVDGEFEPKLCCACGFDKTTFMVEFSHTEDNFAWRICTTCASLILDWLAQQARCREVAILAEDAKYREAEILGDDK